MKPTYAFILIFGCGFVLSSCNTKVPFHPLYESSAAYVIGRENCYTDTSKDYWLLDFSVWPGTKQYGDTIILHGKTYTNVVRSLGLVAPHNMLGQKVALNFTISSNRFKDSGCDVTSADTFYLKEIKIISQGFVGN